MPGTDEILIGLQRGLEVLFARPLAKRLNPGDTVADQPLNATERALSGGLMRVNHTGEVCAQALYQGQAMVARDAQTRQFLLAAAGEENDHLAWCQQRLDELNAHPSYLNPLWYINSFVIGILSGLAGDAWSMGFVDETEKQVEAHLDDHLQRLANNDKKSRAIVSQMQQDEIIHSQHARERGARKLPSPMKLFMRAQAKVMTTLAQII